MIVDMLARRAELAGWVREALPEGFELDACVPTGGGCAAMVATAPDGRELDITDGDASLPFTYSGESQDTESEDFTDEFLGIFIGYRTAPQGKLEYKEEDGYMTLTFQQTVKENVYMAIRCWVAGTPYRDA